MSNILRFGVLAACIAVLAWAVMTPVAADATQRRLLIFSAPNGRALARQREVLAASSQDLRERDLVIEEIVGFGPTAIGHRKRYRIAPDRFAVLLIGKDGGVKLRSAEPVRPERLFAVIDAMPMRQEEMRRR